MIPFRAVVLRELRTLLRTQLGFALAFGVIVFVGLMFLLSWRDLGHSFMLNDRARVGSSLFALLASLQICSSCLVAATLGAASFTGERQRRTLDLLITTGLSPRLLTCAKWCSAVVFVLLIFMACLPLYALVLQLGGVGPDDCLIVMLIGLALIATAGIYGLAFSASAPSTLRAVIGMLAFSLALMLITLFALPPIMLVCSGVFFIFGRTFAMISGGVLYLALISWFCYIKCIARLRAVDSERQLLPGEVAITEQAPAPPEDTRRIAQPYKDNQSAIYQQERRFQGYGLQYTRVGLVVATLMLFVGTVAAVQTTLPTITKTLAVLSLIYIQFFTPLVCATSFARERELGTLPLLMSAPLTPWQIVLGKYRACYWELQSFLGLGTLVACWAIVPFLLEMPFATLTAVGHTILSSALYAAYLTAVCVLLSFWSTSMGQAMMLSYLFVIMGNALPGIVFKMLGLEATQSAGLQALMILVCPYYYIVDWPQTSGAVVMHMGLWIGWTLGTPGLILLITRLLARRRELGALA